MERTLASYITYLQRDFLELTKRELKAFGINYGQLPFILYIGKHEHCTQADLTKKIAIDWGYCQRSINKLSTEGFIEKATNDNHANTLSLTAKGQDVYQVAHDVFRKWDEINLACLSEDEKTTLLALMNKIIATEHSQYTDYFKNKKSKI